MTAGVATLLRELIDGASPDSGFVLNPGDRGLLRSLDLLSAAAASTRPAGGGSSIAAHVDHLRYGLGLLNRWNRGDDPFADADYSASWGRQEVSEGEWAALREGLRREAETWVTSLGQRLDSGEFELTVVIASAVHLAYHLGAIRQIDFTTRGPRARD